MSELLDKLSRAVTRGLEANARHTLEFLGEGTTELQLLGYPDRYAQSRFAHPTSVESAVKLLRQADGANPVGCYVIGNSPDAAVTTRMARDTWHPAPKGSSTKDGDIKARRVLFVDVDAKRVTGTSATDEELGCAITTGVKVYDFLATLVGEHSLAFGHSGNGVSVLIALDSIPESKETHALVAGVVHAVALRFKGEPGVEIDTSVTDAKRLMPAFGTMKRKGAALIEERPHRRTGIVVPDPRELQRVSLAGLKAMLGTLYDETDDEGRAKLDAEMGKITGKKAAPKPAATPAPQHAQAPRGKAREQATEGPDVFKIAKEVPIGDVLSWLGLLDGEGKPRCPGCGLDDQGVAIVKNGLKCSHNRCTEKGHSQGFRTTIDCVVEAKGIKAIDAVREMGERFGFEVPAPKKRQRAKGPDGSAGYARDGEPDWYADLARSSRGELAKTPGNAIAVLALDEAWKGVLCFDELAQGIKTTKPPPWDAVDCAKPEAGDWVDVDTIRLTAWLGRRHGLHVGIDAAHAAVEVAARQNSVDPIKAYLGVLRWDGTRRVDTWLTTYLGVADTPYSRLVSRFFLLAAIARARKPGCKVDTMLILEGDQGARKSTAVRTLFGGEWVSDTPPDLMSKDRFSCMRGRWCVEWGELDGMARGDVDRLKAFLSSPVDDYRAPYARSMSRIPRRSVFVGTVNGECYLRDETGNRRFWPVRVGEIDIDGLSQARDMLWAEAVELYASDPRWWPDSTEVHLFKESQAERVVSDVWMQPIAYYLQKPTTPESWVTLSDLLSDALKLETGRWSQSDQSRAGRCMSLLGWQRVQRRHLGVRQWGYAPPDGWQKSHLQLVPSPL